MQGFPGGFGEVRLRADQVAHHLPGCQIERSFGSRSHSERYGALWAKTDAPRRRFLPRANSRGLGKDEHSYRFFSRFEFTVAAKAKWIVQRYRPVPGLRPEFHANYGQIRNRNIRQMR